MILIQKLHNSHVHNNFVNYKSNLPIWLQIIRTCIPIANYFNYLNWYITLQSTVTPSFHLMNILSRMKTARSLCGKFICSRFFSVVLSFLIGTGFASGSFISINIYSDFVYFMFVINLTKYNTRDMNRSFCTHTRFTFQIMFVSFNSNTTGVTCGAGTSYPCGSYEFTLGFQQGSCCSMLSLLGSVLQIVVCHFVLFIGAIVVFVLLRFTASDYPFGIFRLILN